MAAKTKKKLQINLQLPGCQITLDSLSLFFFYYFFFFPSFSLLTRRLSRGRAWSAARLVANLTNDMSLDPSLGQCPASNNRLGPSWPINSPLSVEPGQWKAPGDFCSSELTDGEDRAERETGRLSVCVRESVSVGDLAWIPKHYWDIFTEEVG